MSISIHIPTPLRPYTGGLDTVDVSANTVGEALTRLTSVHPDLSRHLRDEQGRIRSFVNVYLGDEDIRFQQGEETPVSAGAELTIVPSIAGGAR